MGRLSSRFRWHGTAGTGTAPAPAALAMIFSIRLMSGHRLLAVLAAIPLSAGGGHQLEVVNDHQPQVVDAAALGVHVRHRQQGLSSMRISRRLREEAPSAIFTQSLSRRSPPMRRVFSIRLLAGQQAGHQLVTGHLQREDGHRLAGPWRRSGPRSEPYWSCPCRDGRPAAAGPTCSAVDLTVHRRKPVDRPGRVLAPLSAELPPDAP